VLVRLCPSLTKGRRKTILILGPCIKMFSLSYILCLASFPQNPLRKSHLSHIKPTHILFQI
jgi:hypothetical protein